uniref:Protein kinase domain-containing protein n=1 Tax=viral metagenome TaxID=1070528 RepID=A0A6C0DLA0_9ZZZZ
MNVLNTPKENHKFNADIFDTEYINLEKLKESFESLNEDLEHNYNPFHIQKLQKYNPIYSKLFDFDTCRNIDFDKISLNNKYHFYDNEHTYDFYTKQIYNKNVFIKYSPLLDPIRYMIGKYSIDDSLINLPQYSLCDSDIKPHPKISEPNNASYVDSFFSFLTSKLIEKHNFIHGIDFYGSYLGIQDKYKMNISDDLEYLNNSDYFSENIKKLFSITGFDKNEMFNYGSRANKNRLEIRNTPINIDVFDIGHTSTEETNFVNDIELDNQNIVYLKNDTTISTDDASDSNDDDHNDDSSDSSDDVVDSSDDDDCDDDHDDDCDDDDDTKWDTDNSSNEDDSSSNDSDENEYAYIHNFPVQLICLEKCDGTFDELFENSSITKEEIISGLFQVIMTLLSYQKLFHFTHNDLHTNNIMFINTDIEFLYYRYDGQSYKVPTYGRIYKLIDFGRAIYKFNGKLYCSDSFSLGGDANGQYNFEPYFNDNKPRLEPNYSFDLCRLGCSIYDFIIDNDSDTDVFDDLQKTIYRWCLDDSDRNVLYKRNGEERYPNFKLYKMIARTVHKHTPENQLAFDIFKQFLTPINNINNIENMMDIDILPSYV